MVQIETTPGRSAGILSWVISHPKTSVATVLLTLLVGGLWLFDRAARNSLARQVQAIRAKGEPITPSELAATIPNVPDEDNMAPAIRAVLSAFPHDDFSLKEPCRFMRFAGHGCGYAMGRQFPGRMLEGARQYLLQNDLEIAALHEALNLDGSDLKVNWRSPTSGMSFPDLLCFRNVNVLLGLESVVEAHDEEPKRVDSILRDMIQTDRILENVSALLSVFLRVSAQEDLQHHIVRALNLCDLSGETVQFLQRALADWEPRINRGLKQAFIGERVYAFDFFEQLRTGRAGAAAGIGRLGAVWSAVPGLPSLDSGKALEWMTDRVDAINGLNMETHRRFQAASAGALSAPWYCFFARKRVPNFDHAMLYCVSSVASNRALIAALACERYRLLNNRWPDSLEQLIPAYLDGVPRDPFDESPIRYRQEEDRIILWSVGNDMKDEGGMVGTGRYDRAGDQGWILLNPEFRNQPAIEE